MLTKSTKSTIIIAAFLSAVWADCAEAAVNCCVDSTGDVNQSGGVTIQDYTLLAGWLACQDVSICMDEADMTGDWRVNSLDLIPLDTYLFKGGPAPGPCVAHPDCNTTINTQPVDTGASLGQMFTLRVDAGSVCPMHYRWYRNGVLVGCDSTLIFDPVTPADSGSYQCIILTVSDSVATAPFLFETRGCVSVGDLEVCADSIVDLGSEVYLCAGNVVID